MTALFDRVALIGVGLIGSSLSHAMRSHGLAAHVSAHARSAATRGKVKDLGLAHSVHDTAAAAVVDADLVILCSPVGSYGALAAEIAPALKPGAILTDVGSVKAAVVKDVGPYVPAGVHFIPGHPIAGTEQSGPESGFATLFANRWCILTPLPGCDPQARREARDLLAALRIRRRGHDAGASRSGPGHHQPSAAPHRLQHRGDGCRSRGGDELGSDQVFRRRLPRLHPHRRLRSHHVARRLPQQREAVLEMLGRFTEDLSALQRAIRWGDGETLFTLFSRSREIRRGIIAAGQDTAAPNFGRNPEKSQ